MFALLRKTGPAGAIDVQVRSEAHNHHPRPLCPSACPRRLLSLALHDRARRGPCAPPTLQTLPRSPQLHPLALSEALVKYVESCVIQEEEELAWRATKSAKALDTATRKKRAQHVANESTRLSEREKKGKAVVTDTDAEKGKREARSAEATV